MPGDKANPKVVSTEGLYTARCEMPFNRFVKVQLLRAAHKFAMPQPLANSKISVAIADDHPVFRQGVSTLLALEDDIEVIATAEDGRAAIELLDREDPDILLLDLRMPGMDGLSALRQMSHRERRTRVIVLTASEDQVEYVQAISDGAAGVLLKQTAVDCLADCIRTVNAGEIWVDSEALPLPESMSSPVVRCS